MQLALHFVRATVQIGSLPRSFASRNLYRKHRRVADLEIEIEKERLAAPFNLCSSMTSTLLRNYHFRF